MRDEALWKEMLDHGHRTPSGAVTVEQAVQSVIASIVEVKLDLARIYTAWSVRGPKLEASTAVTAMAQEEAGHARVLGGMLGTEARGQAVESLRQPIDSWPQMLGVVGPADVAVGRLAAILASCPHQQLRSRAGKMRQEEIFHEAFFLGWSKLLLAEPEAVRRCFETSWSRSASEVEAWLKDVDRFAADARLAEAGQVTGECSPSAFLEALG